VIRLTIKQLFTLFCAAVCLSGCDAAMNYTIPGARSVRADGLWYVVPLAEGIEARFHANILMSHGGTVVQVINNSDSLVEFRPAPTVLVTGNGTRLPAGCKLPGEERVLVAKGQTLAVACGFQAWLRRFSYEPDFGVLILMQPGLSIDGKPLEIIATMRGS
jgi:hypothetical protein